MRRARLRIAHWMGTALLAAAACASVPAEDTAANAPHDVREPAATSPTEGREQEQMVPPGYGTLRQDAITVSIRTGALQVKLTPLDEATIRLLAPDTYTRLNALRESRRDEAARNMIRPAELFLVSFFSNQPDTSFQPGDVQLVYQSRLLRPEGIVPVTSGWGRERLGQQETQSAIYAFEGTIEYDQTFTVRYGMEESSEWRSIVPVLEAEKAKIATRVGSNNGINR